MGFVFSIISAGWFVGAIVAMVPSFSLPGESSLAQNKLVTTLPSIGKEYQVSFDMLVTKHKLVDWRNVIHFTIGGNYGTYGERTPGVWIFRNNQLHIASAVNGNHNHIFDWPDPIVEGDWNNIQIYQTLRNNKYIYELKINGKIMLTIENQQAANFKDVAVYAADPWYPSVDGKIRNLLVTDGSVKDCKCGRAKQNRILGGQEAKVNAYPWMAALANQQEVFYCGGTLVASEWVVTASHCLSEDRAQTIPTPPGKLKIVLGEHDKKSTRSKLPRKVLAVTKIIKHPGYNPKTFNNDIALIKLAEAVDLNLYRPACVASIGQEDLMGKKAWVYGWGTTAENGRTSDTLLEVDVPIVSNSVCQAAYTDLGLKITSGMLCAGGVNGQDACQGDSGGPLTLSEGGQHTLVGSVSFGYGCGRANRYGVYARTAAYRQWIDSTIASNGGAPVCSP